MPVIMLLVLKVVANTYRGSRLEVFWQIFGLYRNQELGKRNPCIYAQFNGVEE